jgi:hypothetical protein
MIRPGARAVRLATLPVVDGDAPPAEIAERCQRLVQPVPLRLQALQILCHRPSLVSDLNHYKHSDNAAKKWPRQIFPTFMSHTDLAQTETGTGLFTPCRMETALP